MHSLNILDAYQITNSLGKEKVGTINRFSPYFVLRQICPCSLIVNQDVINLVAGRPGCH